MPIADHGGFDLAVEVSEATVAALARSLPLPASTPRSVGLSGLTGLVFPHVAISEVTLAPVDLFKLVIDLTGTELRVTNAVFNGVPFAVPAWLQVIDIAGRVRVVDALTVSGLALVVDFTRDTARAQPAIQVELDEAVFFASPLVVLYLAQVILANLNNESAYQAARAKLISDVKTEITATSRTLLESLGLVTLMAPPSGVGVTATNFRIGDRALHILFALGGAPGNPNSITRSNLMRNTATGAPADVAAVILSNASLLRDFVCPALTGALGLAGVPRIPGQVCGFLGPVPFALPGSRPSSLARTTLNLILTGTDETQLLRVVLGVSVTDMAGTFTINSTISTAFAFSVTVGPGSTGLTIMLAPAGAPSVSTEVIVSPFVYFMLWLTGGAPLLLINDAVERWAGSLLDGPIGAAIAPRLPTRSVGLPLPAGFPPVTRRLVSLNQTDAATRLLTLGSITFPSPFRDHDLIVNLI